MTTTAWFEDRIEEAPSALSPFLSDLGDDSPEVRKFAAIGLTQTGELEAIPYLERMTQDASPAVRYFARRGIDQIRRAASRSASSAWSHAVEEAASDRIDAVHWKKRLSSQDPLERFRTAAASMRITDPALFPVLIDRLAHEDDPKVLATLLSSIRRHVRADSFETVLPLVSHPDHRVRANAVEVLDDLADPRLLPSLESLIEDPDNRVRGNALKALARWDRPRAFQGAARMASASEIWMRATAVWLLRALGGEPARKLLRLMRERETGDMLGRVETALSALEDELSLAGDSGPASRPAEDGPPSSVPGDPAGLIGVLDGVIQEVSARPPGEATPEKPVAEREDRVAVTRGRIEEGLASGDFRDRVDAVRSAALLPRVEALPLLLGQLEKEDHLHVIASLVKELGTVGSEEHVSLIAGYLSHEDPRIRANAIEGLQAIGSDSIYPHIEPLLGDANNRVRANAARAIHAKDQEKAFETLKDMLLSQDPLLADSALFALKEIGSEQILEILEIGLSSKSQEIQIKVQKVLETLGEGDPKARRLYEQYRDRSTSGPWGQEALDALLSRMDDTDANVRRDVLEALAEFDNPRARLRIRLACKDRNKDVRNRAAELVEAADLEDRKRKLLRALGLAIYQMADKGIDLFPDLASLRQKVKEASRRIDAGGDVFDSVTMRRKALGELGGQVYELYLRHQVREPEVVKLCARIAEVDHERTDRSTTGVAGRPVVSPLRELFQSVPSAIWGGVALLALLLGVALLVTPGGRAGHRIWSHDLAGAGALSASSAGVHVVSADDTLTTLSLDEGSVSWDASFPAIPGTGVVPGLGLVYGSTRDGRVVAFAMEDGEPAFERSLGAKLLGAPIVNGGNLFVLGQDPSDEARVFVLDAAQGEVLRTDAPGAEHPLFLGVTGSNIILVCRQRVLLLERATGRVVANRESSEPHGRASNPLVVSGERAVVVAGRSLLSMDGTGRILWRQSPAEKPFVHSPFLWDGNLFVAEPGRLHIISLDGGRNAGYYPMPSAFGAMYLAGDRLIYASGPDAVEILSLSGSVRATLSGIVGEAVDLAVIGETLFCTTDTGVFALRLPPAL